MKFLTCILLLISFRSMAQSISIELAGNARSNVLFVEKQNLVTIKNLPANAKIKLSHGNIINLGDGQFYINEPYCSYPAYDTVTIYKGAETIDKKIFKLKYDGAPFVKINGLSYCDSVDANNLYKNGRITIFPDSLHYKVTSFEMTLVPMRGDAVLSLPSNSDKLSAFQKQHILGRLSKGAILYFENIKAECPPPCSLPAFKKARIKTIAANSFTYMRVD